MSSNNILPNEILGCVFEYICIPSPGIPNMSLSISHVCRAWYQAAVHYTLLWTYIILDETSGSLSLANLYLERAINAPLQLTIRCKSGRDYSIQSCVVSWLMRYPVNIKSLKVIHISTSRSNYLLPILPCISLSGLETFELMGLNDVELELKTIADILAKTPFLKSLSLSGASELRFHPSMREFACNITHLTIGSLSHIDYAFPLRVDAALEIIGCCKGLLVLECFTLADEEDNDPPVTTLPHLSSLTIGDGPETCRLLFYLAAPRLESFKMAHGKIINEEEEEISMPDLPEDRENFQDLFLGCIRALCHLSNAPRITKLVWESSKVRLELLENCSRYLRNLEEVEISGVSDVSGSIFFPSFQENNSRHFPDIKSLTFFECSLDPKWHHAIEALYRAPQAAPSRNYPRIVFRRCTGKDGKRYSAFAFKWVSVDNVIPIT
ncbi:hypothetical protein Clacol_007761 [Clathrus columnatus]|uniref:F-box domain-containing protein n=1 Tax=Clathrus columnatus TaxID=1419009 RepID=A0AAV5AIB7_9AGAM|nr:hypothetical protein Clacol_007761 [Clathrus columnatus]